MIDVKLDAHDQRATATGGFSRHARRAAGSGCDGASFAPPTFLLFAPGVMVSSIAYMPSARIAPFM
jgi:hypothetical protein